MGKNWFLFNILFCYPLKFTALGKYLVCLSINPSLFDTYNIYHTIILHIRKIYKAKKKKYIYIYNDYYIILTPRRSPILFMGGRLVLGRNLWPKLINGSSYTKTNSCAVIEIKGFICNPLKKIDNPIVIKRGRLLLCVESVYKKSTCLLISSNPISKMSKIDIKSANNFKIFFRILYGISWRFFFKNSWMFNFRQFAI